MLFMSEESVRKHFNGSENFFSDVMDKKHPEICWSNLAHEALGDIDRQLADHGLEIIIIGFDTGGDEFWFIDKRTTITYTATEKVPSFKGKKSVIKLYDWIKDHPGSTMNQILNGYFEGVHPNGRRVEEESKKDQIYTWANSGVLQNERSVWNGEILETRTRDGDRLMECYY